MARKIVHLASNHPPFDTRIFQKQCRSLADSGEEVTLIVPHARHERVDGVNIVAVPPPRSRLERMLLTSYRVVREALRRPADVYHLHDSELLPWAQLLRFKRGSTVVFDMHENMPFSLRTKHWIPAWLRPFVAGSYAMLERLLLQRIPLVFAERSYAPHYPWARGSVVVLNMPLHQQLAALRQQAPERTTAMVSYVGGITRLRSSRKMVRAAAMLKEKGRDLQLDLIGPSEPAETEAMRRLIEELGLSDRVKLHGYLRPAEAWERVNRSGVGLAVLQPAPNYLESFPTKMFEYMALGLPVITSDFPLYREVVEAEGCGLCIDPTSANSLADALEYMLDHPVEAVAMGRRGSAAVAERYSWDVEYLKLRQFYQRTLPSDPVA